MKQLRCWCLFVAALSLGAPGAWAQSACSGEWAIVASPDASNIGYSFDHGPASGFCAAEAARDSSAGVASCVVTAFPVGVGAVTVEQSSGKTVVWEEQPWACVDSTAPAASSSTAASGAAGSLTLVPGAFDVDMAGQAWVWGFTGVMFCYLMSWGVGSVLSMVDSRGK